MSDEQHNTDRFCPHPDRFVDRHVGPREADIAEMLGELGCRSMDELVERAIPRDIRLTGSLNLPPSLDESQLLEEMRTLALRNQVFRSFIGMGYHDCITPQVSSVGQAVQPAQVVQPTAGS